MVEKENLREAHASRMSGLIDQFHSSGQNQTKFCSSHGISVSLFGYWLRRSFSTEKKPLGVHSQQGNFIGLQVSNHSSVGNEPASVELTYPNGVQLRVQGSVSADWLKSLIH